MSSETGATGLEIAIIGMAGRFPAASSVDELWQRLMEGVECIRFFSDEELRAAGISAADLADPSYVKAGGVVDDAALVAALKEKRIAGAAVDVFEGEPKLNPDYLALDNVVLTPHIGSATKSTRLAMLRLAAKNLTAALQGETPPNWVNKELTGGNK